MTESILIRNIKSLVQVQEKPVKKVSGSSMSELNILKDSFVFIKNGLILDFGSMQELTSKKYSEEEDLTIINADNKFVFPSFCDSHTHLVYAGSREQEFADRLKGLSYREIAERGGGILNSALQLHRTSEESLFRQSYERINEIIASGTGALEIKSGYGLNTADELKMLRVIKRISENAPVEVRSTFLGAHAIPEEFRGKREKFISIIIEEMIPKVAEEKLAYYIDVFCDEGFFTIEETEKILETGLRYGLTPKIHANELGFSGGVQTGVKYNALSVDHLECSGPEEIEALADTNTMPTLLPGSAFFTGLPDPPVRKMIKSGLPIALASDYNPGSSPTGNMKLIMSLACIKWKMTPEEAINACTINSAYAMGLSDSHGSVTRGKVANLFITKSIPSIGFMPYAFGSDLIDTVILKGKIISNIK
jgi:imidazolonepropionase